ncbi:NADP-dependent oxidoreductase [uncultured Amnibacterium sp.]|uniref:NADP-dependent oxidoreductase n=1 Tax=uncultured Amnibacterium sp. TaxID=1631851 RepID=UPI0035CC4136
MRAVQFEQYGGPEVLEIAEVDEPHPGPGRIRIRVHAAGVNAADWKIREGLMAGGKPLARPGRVGLDAAGVVDELGEGVTDVRVGDRVFGSGSGTFADLAVLTAWARLPHHIPFEEGAAAPVPVDTAVRMLEAVAATEGDTIVLSGAAGGVGTALIQIAKARGLIVIGTASAANQEYVEALGALHTTYDDGWVDRVRSLAVAEVDAGFDLAGAGVLPQLIELTGDPSRVVSIADFSAPQLGAKVTAGGGDKRAALAEAARLFEAEELRMIVERTFTLEQTPEAQRLSKAGHGRGRSAVVLHR